MTDDTDLKIVVCLRCRAVDGPCRLIDHPSLAMQVSGEITETPLLEDNEAGCQLQGLLSVWVMVNIPVKVRSR
jgi:hypothetical protein